MILSRNSPMTQRDIQKFRARLQQPYTKAQHQLLRTISGSTRYQILVLLRAKPAGMTVTDMAKVLRGSLSRISHQMRILRSRKLVAAQRRRREVIYRAVKNPVVDALL